MKKNYFMLALASMMMAACANNDLVDEGVLKEEVPQAIEFETFAQKVTRAENSEETYSLDLKDHHTSFKVWGYKNVQADYVFNGKEVSYDDTDEAWDYTGHVYWDKAATSYDFYAAAPSSTIWTLNNNNDATQNNDYFTISSNYTVTAHNNTSLVYANSFANTTNAVDLMIAESNTVTGNTLFTSPVQLNFTHILSRLNITVSKHASMASQTVTLKSLTLYNVNNVGTFNENATLSTETLAGGTHQRWNITSDVTNYTVNPSNGITLKYVSDAATLPTGATRTAEYMLQSLIMPQTAGFETVKLDGTSTNNLQEPYFTIVYTVIDDGNSEDFSATYNLAAAFGLRPTTNNDGSVTQPSPLAFNEGWQNTLNITLQPGAISFSANVATWDDNQTPDLSIN